MSETEDPSEPEIAEAIPDQKIDPPAPVEQLKAALVLIPALGILWLVIHYLPGFGDWMGKLSDQVVGEVTAGGTSDEEEEGGKEESTPSTASPDSAPSPATDYRSQIVEQMGGPDRVEVRHLALADDEKKMVAALQVIDNEGNSRLIEVFFERDEFGRYLSTGDSPVDQPLKLWKE
ncbi:MAG: hypothetical protein P1U87_21730 [Verrucomicrobiales bacterium]|nr:hypothetical protein [Verrucomicrobiales bacterium]